MSLLFLSKDDFHLEESRKGGLLLCNCINRGISFILFYVSQCEHSQKILPFFKRLPGSIQGIQFGISLATQPLIALAKKTISPIQYVPLMILYVNGRPFVRYDGNYNENSIKDFIIDYGNKISSRERDTFAQQKKQIENDQRSKYLNPYPGSLPSPQLKFPQQQQHQNNPQAFQAHPYNIYNHFEEIPAYSLGQPKREEVTYLELEEAYLN